MESKICQNPECGKLLIKRLREPPYSYRKRKTCGTDCANRLFSYLFKGRKLKEKKELICIFCGEKKMLNPSSWSNGRIPKYCSRRCKDDARPKKGKYTSSKIINCRTCGREKRIPNCQINTTGNFCSPRCYHEFLKGRIVYDRSSSKLSEEQKDKIRKSLLKRKIDDPKYIANCSNGKKWRKLIVEGSRCFYCNNSDTQITAHHLFSRNKYPEFGFYIDNGVALCIGCHVSWHNHDSVPLETTINKLRYDFAIKHPEELGEWIEFYKDFS